MDINKCLNDMKELLEGRSEHETPKRKAAREKALDRIEELMKEFNELSQKICTTPEQLNVVSQLGKIMLQLTNIKGK